MKIDPFNKPCPCGAQTNFDLCCGRYLSGFEAAPTPEALMRSRFTAFATGTSDALDYLIATHHPDYRQPELQQDLKGNKADTEWLSLQVRSSSMHGDKGVVDFVAGFRHKGKVGEMREKSCFVREKGLWFYTEGQ